MEKHRTFESGSGRAGHIPDGKHGACQGGGETLDVRRGPCVITTTTGWQPTCECGREDTAPCVVLDPFSGSSTTGVVCARYGRHYIGIDINEQYLQMSIKRLEPVLAQPKLLEVV